jgi:GAF domain-containing protein
MTSATNSANAATRRATALSKLDVLDTAPEADFDQLAQLAQTLCQTPIVTIGLLDAQREWFRASIGIEATELPIEESLAARVVAGPQVLVVPDATKNSRFATLPLVSAPNGVSLWSPLRMASGFSHPLPCSLATARRSVPSP